MTFISADYLFDGVRFLSKETTLNIDEKGMILEILEKEKHPDTIHYQGLLMPGMVNAHCHLELSYLKDKIPQHTGLVPFLMSITKYRQHFTDEEKQIEIEKAQQEMIQNGIVAVGDISNSMDSFFHKKDNKLIYHTFIECFGLNEEFAEKILDKAHDLYIQFSSLHPSSIVLHAPYSVSQKLLKLVDEQNKNGQVTTIHNQESFDEDKLFQALEGNFLKLFEHVHFEKKNFHFEKKSSIQTYLKELRNQKNIVLVHNTFTSLEDIRYAKQFDKNLFWCLCPNANLYIENTLPQIENFIKENVTIVLGTDSLASNHQLNIWDEMKTLRKSFPKIPIQEMLKWATSNGAKALGIETKMGTFQISTQPGIVQIENFILNEIQLNETPKALFPASVL